MGAPSIEGHQAAHPGTHDANAHVLIWFAMLGTPLL